MSIEWRWYDFAELSAAELHELFAARQAVFVVEQKSAFQDIDGLDPVAAHLIGRSGSVLAASLRLLPPHALHAEHSIGRVFTARDFRRQGLARIAMRLALERVPSHMPVRIGAQLHLENFYSSLGFCRTGEPYDDAGVTHVEMLKGAP
jgi:ElaA protein